jgi:hypothetical protein
MNGLRRIFLLMAFVCSWAAYSSDDSYDPSAASRTCTSDDLQPCRTCVQISRVTSHEPPNGGEYLHGAQWNGLYAAYVRNCLKVAEDLLKRGADPNWGGSSGSMVISVSNQWPHNDIRINRKWAELLLKYGATARKIVPDQDKSPEAMLKTREFEPEYPELFKKFQR